MCSGLALGPQDLIRRVAPLVESSHCGALKLHEAPFCCLAFGRETDRIAENENNADVRTICPVCDCIDLVDVDLSTNLTEAHKKTDRPRRHLGGRLRLLSALRALVSPGTARIRKEVDNYYGAFPEIQKRHYAVYPLPQRFYRGATTVQRTPHRKHRKGRADPPRYERSQYPVRVRSSSCAPCATNMACGSSTASITSRPTYATHARILGLESIEYLHPYQAQIPFERKQFESDPGEPSPDARVRPDGSSGPFARACRTRRPRSFSTMSSITRD